MSLLTAIIPWFGGNPSALQKTIESTKGICDESLVVHQPLFESDTEIALSLADKVEVVNFNQVFQFGYGDLPNHHGQASGQWMLLLGTGETIAEELFPIRQTISNGPKYEIYQCNHHGDPHLWGRIWCPSSGVHWKAWIHEEAGPVRNGAVGPTIFRMQDLDKPKHEDPFVNECLKWYKTTSYNFCYKKLLNNPSQRGFCNEGWTGFVNGAKESILGFCEEHSDLVSACESGDRESFYEGVRRRMDLEKPPIQNVNFNPTGDEFSEGALPLATL